LLLLLLLLLDSAYEVGGWLHVGWISAAAAAAAAAAATLGV
jgi:hypothetical protein